MKLIITICSIACTGLWIAEVSGIVKFIKYRLKYHTKWYNNKHWSEIKLKPLDCPKCLTTWIGLFYFYFQLNYSIFETIFYSLTASILSVIISKLITYVK
jgi:hypothetical protein